MRLEVLSVGEVLAGYDAVSRLYAYVPPMSAWRAWEYGAYHRYQLAEPVLDVGCGDGTFFRLLWPQLRDVVGVEMDATAAEAARRSGVYREVQVAPAHEAPVPAGAFGGAFANCSLEHMDHLPEVLQAGYERYQHLVNPLPPAVWGEHLGRAGFEVEVHIPIVPELSSRLFLLLDQLWHVPRPAGELGDVLHPYLTRLPHFAAGFRQVLAGVLEMEPEWSIGSGAVFVARKRR